MPHCYDFEGNKHFDLTPKEAKEMGLLFSVTEMHKVLASPGLERWKLNTAIEHTDSFPRRPSETMEAFRKRVIRDMYDGSATDLGTSVHDGIESVLSKQRQMKDVHEDLIPYVKPAVEWFLNKGYDIIDLEKVVINKAEGYAGMADVIAKVPGKDQFFILDWKTTKTIPSSPYPEHLEQVSAYAVAQFGEEMVRDGKVWGCNYYISTSVIDKKTGLPKVKIAPHEPKTLPVNYDNFCKVAELWRIRNNYDPRPGSNRN